MQADELLSAVTKIVTMLKDAGIRSAIDQYRVAKGDQRTAAAATLSHAGSLLVASIDSMTPTEQEVVKCLHLGSLGSTDYWNKLVGGNDDPKQHQAEIVRLASRVMFSGNHLPSMVALLDKVEQPAPAMVKTVEMPTDSVNPLSLPIEEGEGALLIRLTDAGERASDPDRVARAIDGIDMLYSACASIARKPAIDLRLDGVMAKQNRDRDFRFTGERDSVSAVFAVVDSIPAALANIDPEKDIDLDAIVRSLPIFDDLNTLASLGTFSGKDLKDISETMHQGALLTLESGVILIDEEMLATGGIEMPGQHTTGHNNVAAAAPMAAAQSASADANDNTAQLGGQAPSAAESDEHYNRYLREREALMRTQPTAADTGSNLNDSGVGAATGDNGSAQGYSAEGDDQTRRDAVDELLKSLGQSKTT